MLGKLCTECLWKFVLIVGASRCSAGQMVKSTPYLQEEHRVALAYGYTWAHSYTDIQVAVFPRKPYDLWFPSAYPPSAGPAGPGCRPPPRPLTSVGFFMSRLRALVMVGYQGGWGRRAKALGNRGREVMVHD